MNKTNSLASWNDGAAKAAIIEFVEKVTAGDSSTNPNYVAPEDRIATFDNDGTLWAEKPIYFQGYFIQSNLPQGEKLIEKKVPLTKEDILEIEADLFPNMTTEDYTNTAKSFVLNTDYTDYVPGDDRFTSYKFVNMIYKPVIDLVEYLQEHEFKVYICSGGGRDFVRSFAQEAYGIPPENVIGTSVVTEYDPTQGSGGDVIRTKFRENNGEGQVDHGLGQYNDKEGKPVGIQRQIGKRPILACGNSTGDLQMFDYTDQGVGDSLIVLINHDDAAREFQYNDDPNEENSPEDIADGADQYKNESLHKAMEASNPHWIVVSMASDFLDPIFRPYPF